MERRPQSIPSASPSETDLRDLLSEARLTAARLDQALAAGAAAEREALDRLRSQLVTAAEPSYPQPMFVDQVEYLYSMLTTADQHPGRDAAER